MAIVGHNLSLLVKTQDDGNIMDISGSVTGIETRGFPGELVETTLTLIHEESNPAGAWDFDKILNIGEVIVKCSWCGKWAVVETNCKYCGGAV